MRPLTEKTKVTMLQRRSCCDIRAEDNDSKCFNILLSALKTEVDFFTMVSPQA